TTVAGGGVGAGPSAEPERRSNTATPRPRSSATAPPPITSPAGTPARPTGGTGVGGRVARGGISGKPDGAGGEGRGGGVREPVLGDSEGGAGSAFATATGARGARGTRRVTVSSGI